MLPNLSLLHQGLENSAWTLEVLTVAEMEVREAFAAFDRREAMSAELGHVP
jgi:hypothetical protein